MQSSRYFQATEQCLGQPYVTGVDATAWSDLANHYGENSSPSASPPSPSLPASLFPLQFSYLPYYSIQEAAPKV